MQTVLSRQLVEVWFTHLASHMRGFLSACIFEVDQSSQRAGGIMVSSHEYTGEDRALLAVESAIKRRKPIVQKLASERSHEQAATANGAAVSDIEWNIFLVSCPIIIERKVAAVFSVECRSRRDERGFDPLAEAESAIAWLTSLQHSAVGVGGDDRAARARLAVELCSLCVSHEDAHTAATAVASRLESTLYCERVCIGFGDEEGIELYAMSNSASYETKQNLIKRIEAAMQEGIDQQATLCFPSQQQSFHSLQAHKELSSQHENNAVCSVPMMHGDDIIGSVCYERGQMHGNFQPGETELCEQITTLLGPLLYYRRNDELSIRQKVLRAADHSIREVTSNNKLGKHLLIATSVLALITVSLLDWPYRIAADASLEGAIERVVTAPEEGFIATASARPGDIVKREQLLATLDDRDLQLEKLKWSGKSQQVSREFREALAGNDRSRIGILRAQRDQAEAQLSILQKKLQRTRVAAPIDGVVVSGDLTQSLGSPVDKGQILYTLSPLDDYRVILQVDEAEVAEVAVGMQGELTLNADVEGSIAFTVDKVTPVSTAENGANTFQVEATLATTPPYLRPGMQGIGKVTAGERSLLWIWTHDMIDWLRLRLWAWL